MHFDVIEGLTLTEIVVIDGCEEAPTMATDDGLQISTVDVERQSFEPIHGLAAFLRLRSQINLKTKKNLRKRGEQDGGRQSIFIYLVIYSSIFCIFLSYLYLSFLILIIFSFWVFITKLLLFLPYFLGVHMYMYHICMYVHILFAFLSFFVSWFC